MSKKSAFEEIKASRNDYALNGLDNIFLLDGYTPDGHAIRFQNPCGLSKAVGRWLISLPRGLNGDELFVLRHSLNLTWDELGDVLGVSAAKLNSWEKAGKAPIDKAADRFFRTYYADKEGLGMSAKDIADILSSGREPPVALYLRFDGAQWIEVSPPEPVA